MLSLLATILPLPILDAMNGVVRSLGYPVVHEVGTRGGGNAVVLLTPGDDTAKTRALGESMVALARRRSRDPEFVWWARAVVRDVPSKAHRAILRRLLEWDRANVTYRYDPLGLEWQQDPKHTLLVDGGGDCNNMASMLAGQAVALGYPAQIRFVKSDRSRPDEFSHVYPLVGVPDGRGGDDWVALDPTTAGAEPGWQPPHWERMDLVVA